MSLQKYRVNDKASNGLFLRSEPVVKDSTKIARLPMGQLVIKKAESSTPPWWEVSTTLDGASAEGFVHSGYLSPDSAFTPPPPLSSIAPVHLSTTSKVTRSDQSRLAYPLDEASQPTRNPGDPASAKAQALTRIVNWLDVENKARYAPNSQHTYCNIYSYDYCYLAGVYLPRVWWSSSALDSLRKGKPVSPIYGRTVDELNANSLFGLLRDYGPKFGWSRTVDFTQMQNAANDGQVVIICGQNKVPNHSGHICPVVPEAAGNTATRSGSAITLPLQSQAGRSNRKYFTRAWWTNGTFKDWGFWINAT